MRALDLRHLKICAQSVKLRDLVEWRLEQQKQQESNDVHDLNFRILEEPVRFRKPGKILISCLSCQISISFLLP